MLPFQGFLATDQHRVFDEAGVTRSDNPRPDHGILGNDGKPASKFGSGKVMVRNSYTQQTLFPGLKK